MISLLKLKPYAGDRVAPSPNRSARMAAGIRGIVLHATADEGHEALSLSWMRSPKSRVSCHLLVGRDGRVTRLVGDRHRAWHAGLARWRGTRDVNSITLGIEIANRNDGEPFTRAQYRRVADIVAHYCRQGLSLDDVVSHGAIAGGRKSDPRGWDWDHFRAMVRYRMRPARKRQRPAHASVHHASAHETSAPHASAPHVSALLASATHAGATHAGATPAGARLIAAASSPLPRFGASKPVLRSRTLWLNGMTVLASGGLLAADALDLAHRYGIEVPMDATKWALFGVGLVSIVLRLRTTQPLACGQRVESAHDTRPRGGALASAVHSGRGVPPDFG